MKKVLRKFWNDESGFVVSVELILIATIVVIGLVSGLTMLRDSVLAELGDTANAIGSLDQSYGVSAADYDGGTGASSAAMDWTDAPDTADSASGIALTVGTGLRVVDATSIASDNDNEVN